MIGTVFSMDKIVIKGLKIFAFHGVNPEEKRDGQNFIFDVTLYTPLINAGNTDNVDDTISYSKASKLIVNVVKEKSYDLLEGVAKVVIDALFSEFKSLRAVKVLIKKPEAPMKMDFEYMGVEVYRERENIYD